MPRAAASCPSSSVKADKGQHDRPNLVQMLEEHLVSAREATLFWQASDARVGQRALVHVHLH